MNLPLTARERQIARLIGVECLTSKEIGRRLGTSFRTVETQRRKIFGKLHVRNAIELARQMAGGS